MVSLPELTSYSSEQLSSARLRSPAFANYERLLLLAETGPLHRIRHKAWMECVMATYFATATTQVICAYWSQQADIILQRCWNECGLHEFDAVLFALGKHGAEELNLSSDIDLLLVAEPKHALEVEKRFRRFQQILHSPGAHGFCFRLDFDLRPGGKMGPLVTSPSQFQDYYWSQGETWERLALVRLRCIAGSVMLGRQISDLAKRFSFRKFLDFTLLDDLKALRTQVHQKGFVRKDGEIHIKLEVGGIRDIELFVHSLLVLNGGKASHLQLRSTSQALDILGERGILKPSEALQLKENYWYFRHLENSMQSIEDRQTHYLTDSALKLLGLPDRTEVGRHMEVVDQTVASLLGQVDLSQPQLPADEERQLQWLSELGFLDSTVSTAWPQLMAATALSHKNDRDERARQEFIYAFVTELSKHSKLDRDLGLQLLVDFVRATRAKATFFSMLLRAPRIIQDLARLFCLSPYLGSILSSRPELLDHFILQVDEPWSSDMERLLQQMSERKLLTELWSASQFLNDLNLQGLFARVTATADEIASQLLSQLRHEYPDSLIKIIALGKWGGEELGLRSDLDLIFVTPHAPRESDFKVARRFISRLTDPTKGGNLYEVDLRLRPSGQSGPLLVAADKLQDYWRDTAQAWERQAYLRARPITFELDKSVLIQKGVTSEELHELKRIRQKLLQAKSATAIDLKHVPGGLIDIEFVAQTALLVAKMPSPASTLGMIDALGESSAEWHAASTRLTAIYMRLRQFEQMVGLSSAYKIAVLKPDSLDFKKASALLGATPEEAWLELQTLTSDARQILNGLDPTDLII